MRRERNDNNDDDDDDDGVVDEIDSEKNLENRSTASAHCFATRDL